MTIDQTTLNWIQTVGTISAVAMPFWNIPLILRIIKRGSASDISLPWVVGVWISVIAMLPSSLFSQDQVLRLFGLVNAILFTGVFITVLRYYKK